jgi:uncharacterized membrane protein (TIGR02234 family)
MSQAPRGARTFWPVAFLGIAASGLVALAGHRALMQVQPQHLEQLGAGAIAQGDNVKELPLAGAFGLVMLACWGVVLVTRRVTRRILAALAAVASAGVLVTVVVEGFAKRDDVEIELHAPIEYTGWFWLALVASVPALLAAVAAFRLAPEWPEMGSRYDAPTGRDAATTHDTDTPVEERTSLDLWKSMDEGEDPTEDPSH